MGTGAYEPKFPPSETDFHHLHHSGYGMNGITANHMDYSYHNHNGYNYGNYTPTPTTPFYHHHPPYGSPQMHHHNAPSPNITPQSNSSYVANVLSNNNSNGVGNRNSSTTIPTATSTSSAVVNGLNVSENSSNVDSSVGYYNSFYGTTNGHDPQDLPLQCPSSEPPANTALGLHELGKKLWDCVKILMRMKNEVRNFATAKS